MTEWRSVIPEWFGELTMQQQSVVLLAARGPDGISKDHPVKDVQRAYRGTVFLAAYYGRPLAYGEKADGFMSMDWFGSDLAWPVTVARFLASLDTLPHHYIMHLLYGAEILGYKHPDLRYRRRWLGLYVDTVTEIHLKPESEEEMDTRLGDWRQTHWEES